MRPPRALYVSITYLGALTLGAVVLGGVAVWFEVTRTPTNQLTMGDAVRVIPNLRHGVVQGFIALMGVAAIYGGLVVRGLVRRRGWARWLAMVPPIALPVLFYVFDLALRDIEGVYYRRSPWVRMFWYAAVPIATVGLVHLVALWLPAVRGWFRAPAPDSTEVNP